MAARSVKEGDSRPLKIFFEDEASFGRMGGYHRCWVPKSDRAIVKKQQIRQYLYAFTAVCPETGESCSIISPVCNTDAMRALLEEASKMYAHYRILMIVDGAAWHTTKKLKVPENIELLPLPAYSPELNPTEHIWDYIREQKRFKNHVFESLDAVEAQLVIALNDVHEEKEVMKSMCLSNWISYGLMAV